ncbi:MAG: phenylalanine--tRNA ligase subunit alpha [Sphingomonadaceae bacterium]|uniref:phenylalanine--tRNA ligase subunit alpha n=1 Tax=Thermaurantiacus sp. TaxID=2820283 RepID=UPI00298EF58F|nr:phenylalanine--tRNA ligase subunit alpha [Thermaurantiacus sp.]MCS6987390.1 phenylalanine--tRNA ligase subunit alpha [Sphingomonadaceae bacterium]MDW8415310.1 phenylalanine--tRNA ligase subunit alpha [Thermaurantiacus sp.]
MTDAASAAEALRLRLSAAIAAARTLEELEAVRVRALGRAGEVTALLKTLGALAPDERRVRAPVYQRLRDELTSALEARKAVLEREALARRLVAEREDLSLPAEPPRPGTLHPVTRVVEELLEIFADLGFAMAEGPEIEDDWHNFTALNIPPEHPARAMHDTFYLTDGRLLRTHTSPVQIRTMTATAPPIRIVAPGRVYRADSDATHTPMFHQVEGLVVDRDVHLGHLRWTLETFVKAFFEVEAVTLRFRPSFFPFTEPSVEVDVGCRREGGRLVIGGEGQWLEILGAGMVHPRVLANCGIDPERWQGFAFGCGIDRLAMLKYGMTDLRAFFDADLRWLAHFGFSALRAPSLALGLSA